MLPTNCCCRPVTVMTFRRTMFFQLNAEQRQLKVLPIDAGSSAIQRNIIAREMRRA
jgi:hypothetical protein